MDGNFGPVEYPIGCESPNFTGYCVRIEVGRGPGPSVASVARGRAGASHGFQR